jgi:hypothetical protein
VAKDDAANRHFSGIVCPALALLIVGWLSTGA